MRQKPLKNIDSAARSRFLKNWAYTSLPLGILGMVVGLKVYKSFGLGLLFGLLGGLLGAVISYFLIEQLGSLTGNLIYGKRKPQWSDAEKFEGPLNQARHLRQKDNFNKANEIVDKVLEQAPDLPEALYLKAQILWEGYGDGNAAKEYLQRIVSTLPDQNETYHRWAITMAQEINRG